MGILIWSMYGPAYLVLFDVKLVVILTQYSQALMDSQTGVDSDIKQKNQMIWPNMYKYIMNCILNFWTYLLSLPENDKLMQNIRT